MADYDNIIIDENVLAAWLDGTLSPEEDEAFMNICAGDPEMSEILEANDQVDDYYENLVDEGYELPEEFSGDFELPNIVSFDDDNVYQYDDQVELYDKENDEDHYMMNVSKETEDGNYISDNDDFLDHEENDDLGNDDLAYQDIDII